jgi:hypothetical protein
MERAAQGRDRAARKSGEAIDEVAGEIQVPLHEVEEWLVGGQQSLKRHGLDLEKTGAPPAPGEGRRHDDAPRAGMSRPRRPIVGKRYPLQTVYGFRGAAATAPP